MLSEAEYYTALQNVHNTPSHIQVQHRQNYTKLLKTKKIVQNNTISKPILVQHNHQSSNKTKRSILN